MNLSDSLNKWGPIGLAAVCVFLGIRLVSEISGPVGLGAKSVASKVVRREQRHRTAAAGLNAGLVAKDDDSLLRLGLLKSLEGRPLPEVARDPFDFAPVAPPKPAGHGTAGSEVSSPPPPPPIPLRAFGYSVDQRGRRRAYLANAEEVFVVTQGSLVSNRFKVLQITPAMVEVQDAASGQKAELPIPQER